MQLIKHKLAKFFPALALLLLIGLAAATPATAATSTCTGNGVFGPTGDCTPNPSSTTSTNNGTNNASTQSAGISSQPLTDCTGDNATNAAIKCSEIMTKFVNPLVKFLAIGVGVVVVIMLIWGGVQYTMAGGDPQAVSNARKKILNAVIAFVAFIFLYGILNWLTPGGVPLGP